MCVCRKRVEGEQAGKSGITWPFYFSSVCLACVHIATLKVSRIDDREFSRLVFNLIREQFHIEKSWKHAAPIVRQSWWKLTDLFPIFLYLLFSFLSSIVCLLFSSKRGWIAFSSYILTAPKILTNRLQLRIFINIVEEQFQYKVDDRDDLDQSVKNM